MTAGERSEEGELRRGLAEIDSPSSHIGLEVGSLATMMRPKHRVLTTKGRYEKREAGKTEKYRGEAAPLNKKDVCSMTREPAGKYHADSGSR